MAITVKLGRTLTTGVAAGLLLLGSVTGTAGARVNAAFRAPSTAVSAGGRSVPAPGRSSALFGAACASAGNCWAVGLYNTSRGELNQALHWNGRRWLLVATPTPGLTSRLTGAACVSSGNCWAVGLYQTSQTVLNLVLHWDGRRWSLVSTPKPGGTSGFSDLASIRCTSASDCWAVGGYGAGSGPVATLNQALHWNGRRWSLVSTPQPGGTARGDFSVLGGIRCTSANSCWAVGSHGSTASQNTDLNQVLHWNGRRWSLVPTPQPGGTASGDFSVLSHVSCASPSSCWAVGAYGTIGTTGSQLTELNQALHWNGRRWSLASLPEPDGTGTGAVNQLNDVFCTSPADCWAVGRFGSSSTGGVSVNQALHWNGRGWSLVPTPDPGGTDIGDSNHLYSIRCTSSADCWAVGSVQPTGQNGRNQILHWNGARWSGG